MSGASLLVHRGSGLYLRDFTGRLATWTRDPGDAREYTLREAEGIVCYLNENLGLRCEALEPVLAAITSTQRWCPRVDTNPQDTLTLPRLARVDV